MKDFDFRFHHMCNVQGKICYFINDHVRRHMPVFANFMIANITTVWKKLFADKNCTSQNIPAVWYIIVTYRYAIL